MMSEQKFSPSPKMLDFLEAYCEPGLKKSIKSICEKAGVSRTIYYEWINTDGFEDWLHDEYAKSRRRARPMLIDAQTSRALEGDTQAYKAVMQTGDDLAYRPGGSDMSVRATGPVEIVIEGWKRDPEG